MIGLLLVFARGWRDPWWRFVVYGLAVSIVPGAITNEPFHQLRLMGYAVFLLVLTIPALDWLLAPTEYKADCMQVPSRGSRTAASSRSRHVAHATGSLSRPIRLGFLGILLAATVAQAVDFQITFWREGPKRLYDFDVPYKPLYDRAVAQPQRPIYLENGQWGPAYMDAYWYATVERRPLSEFIRLPDGAKPPPGAIVLSSNSECQNCRDHPEERVLPALQGEVERQGTREGIGSSYPPNVNFVSFSATATSLLGVNRFTHYITRTPLHLFVNPGEVFANNAQADHQ